MANQIRYSLQAGSLPNGITLNPSTGRLTGTMGFDALGLGPSWTGPAAGLLGGFNENDVVAPITFTASSAVGPVIFSVVSGTMPWGIRLAPLTGVLSGTISPLKQRVNETPSNIDGPEWNTAFGTLATYNENATVSVTLSATPIGTRTIKNYNLINGFLPFGLKLNQSTGVISGTTSYLKIPDTYVDVPKLPIPVWTTVSGSLATFNEFQGGTWTMVATPASGRTMTKYNIVGGFLPFGFKLNQRTGVISGTASELLNRNEPPYYDPAKTLTLQDTVSGKTVLEGGSLGTFNKGNTPYFVFSHSTVPNFNGERWFLDSGSVPRGMRITNNGTLTGTIVNSALTKSGLYSFRVGIAAASTSSAETYYGYRNYTITVN